MPHIRVLLFSLLALSNKTKKKRKEATWKTARKNKKRKAVKDYLRKVNNALPQWIQIIQKPLITSSDLMKFYVVFLKTGFSALRFIFSNFLHTFRIEEVISANINLLQSDTMMQN